MSADPNLTAALEASLENLDEQGNEISPLDEVDERALSILWERITNNLAMGLPREITDQDLLMMVRRYRAQRMRWDQEEETKTPHRKRSSGGTKTKAPAAPPVGAQDW